MTVLAMMLWAWLTGEPTVGTSGNLLGEPSVVTSGDRQGTVTY